MEAKAKEKSYISSDLLLQWSSSSIDIHSLSLDLGALWHTAAVHVDMMSSDAFQYPMQTKIFGQIQGSRFIACYCILYIDLIGEYGVWSVYSLKLSATYIVHI